jgi:tocopherol cyclase
MPYDPWRQGFYQGGGKRRRYFEGWYFKQVSADFSEAWAFIPGISRGEAAGEGYSFVQAIEGRTGRSWWFEYPLGAFEASPRSLDIRVGASRFSAAGISLDLSGEGSAFRGELEYGGLRAPPLRILSPGVMGPFSFIPFMQCRHGLVSIDHRVEGGFELEGRRIDMSGGRGYIEKDWGSSMPSSWIWMQSNNFPERGDSFMLSIADIPWLDKSFTGFLCVGALGRRASQGGRFLREATYTGARIEDFRMDDAEIALAIVRGSSRIEVSARRTRGGFLRAPVNGLLSRRIAESGDASISLRWTRGEGLLFEGEARAAGLELVGDPASLLDGAPGTRRRGSRPSL